MKKFKGHLNHRQVLAACAKAGFEVDTSRYDDGGDWITICGTFGDKSLRIIYSIWNGKFIGELPDGAVFSEASERFEGSDWYDAILDFLYIAADDKAA
ncbi:hypothetical protein [Thalassospira sp.]|uniref:hypothetical protein n=1 Tax=Thalassospira sp. TaxID=1912094 RepID=UPI000C5B1427|nr:hypothetical protein [Thalassospira sp.]MBC06333.1 hypothetical protein [Thalassospira sp.]|tara:strand:+ start:6341 stop:6634 length:294 start_codon:yes stop_codon:yes gene_type:complete